ncbi:MAG: YeaC family protein [Marinobacter sp.]|uniref:YeaC family protein n=1 Tax=Marinobacter sp. TaxID=50741 RepID=UPI003F9A72B9
MTYEELIARLDPNVYQSLRQAIELGKWPDGRKLTPQQREISLEAVIYYESRHNIPEQERVGYLDRGSKAGTECDPTVRGNRSGDNGADPKQFVEVKS